MYTDKHKEELRGIMTDAINTLLTSCAKITAIITEPSHDPSQEEIDECMFLQNNILNTVFSLVDLIKKPDGFTKEIQFFSVYPKICKCYSSIIDYMSKYAEPYNDSGNTSNDGDISPYLKEIMDKWFPSL